MVPPIVTLVAGENTRTGLTAAPATPPDVMEEKFVIAPAETVSVDAVKITATSTITLLNFILKSNVLGLWRCCLLVAAMSQCGL